jgi:hypothetical protein
MKDLYLSKWKNYIDEQRKQQPNIVLQLGQSKSAYRLLVRKARVHGMAALLVVSTCKRVLPYMVTTKHSLIL